MSVDPTKDKTDPAPNPETNPPTDPPVDPKDKILAEAVDDLRKDIGMESKAFKDAFGDLNVAQQYAALKAAKAAIKKAPARNEPISKQPTGQGNKSPHAGNVIKNGTEVEWKIPISALFTTKK